MSLSVCLCGYFFVLFIFLSQAKKKPQDSAFFVSLYRAVESVIKTFPAFACSIVGSGCLSDRGRGTVGVQEAAEQSEGCSDPCIFTEAVSRCKSQPQSSFAGEGTGQRRRRAADR